MKQNLKELAICIFLLLNVALCVQVTLAQKATKQIAKAEHTTQKPADNQSEEIVIRNTEEAGGFEIENKGEDIKLSWRVLVEKKTPDGNWKQLYSSPASLNIMLAKDCQSLPEEKTTAKSVKVRYKPSCQKLAKGEVLRVKKWTGFGCRAQCNRHCVSDGNFGLGVFRFVVESCDKKKKYYGAEFSFTADDLRKNSPS